MITLKKFINQFLPPFMHKMINYYHYKKSTKGQKSPYDRNIISDKKELKHFCHDALFVVIDNTLNTCIGEQSFQNDCNISFITPDEFFSNERYINIIEPSILHLSSTIQYVLEWRDFLKKIIDKSSPNIITICRFPLFEKSKQEAYAV